jgi:hypothetical protein
MDSGVAASSQGHKAAHGKNPNRPRGLALDENDYMEDLVYNLFELDSMEGQGLRLPGDEAAAEEEDNCKAHGGHLD